MINGAHVVIYSKNAEADRALFKDVLKFSFVDARGSWLIFRLPPAEVAVHPSDENDMHELYLMTDDLDAEMAALRQTRVPCEEATQSLGPRHADQAPRRRNLGTLSAAPRAALNLGCGVRMRAPLPAMSGRRMLLPRFTKAGSRLRVPARSYDVVVMSGRSATRAGAGIAQIAGKEMDGRMYYQVVIQCMKSLKNLEAWLDKAERHAAAKKFDVGVLLNGRLAPDQKPFIYQVQSACDYVKLAAGWLSGQMPPKHPDTEQTIGDLRARIQKTVAFVESIGESQYAGVSDRKVSLSWAPGKVMAAPDYLLQMTIPNTYFHLTTAYSILRHNGVDVGKMDFLGPIKLVEA